MAEIHHLENREIAISQRKSQMTKYKHCKNSRWRTSVVFGYNSAADCPISVNDCVIFSLCGRH